MVKWYGSTEIWQYNHQMCSTKSWVNCLEYPANVYSRVKHVDYKCKKKPVMQRSSNSTWRLGTWTELVVAMACPLFCIQAITWSTACLYSIRSLWTNLWHLSEIHPFSCDLPHTNLSFAKCRLFFFNPQRIGSVVCLWVVTLCELWWQWSYIENGVL